MSFKPRVKPNEPLATQDESKVEAFLNRGEQQEEEKSLADILKDLDPNAARKYTTYTLQMNEYEYVILKALAKQENRPVANVMRYAIMELAKKNDLI